MSFYLIIYFFAGLLQDFLWTINIRYIAKGKIVLSAVTSFLATIVMFFVLYSILAKLETERSIVAIIVYALGVGIGTVVAMKMKMKRTKE